MPLNFQNVPLALVGVDQKRHRLTRGAGTLDRAINVVFEKVGEQVVAQKRLGYQRVDCSESAGRFSADSVWTACASTPAGELVLFGHRWAFGVASPDAAMRGEDSIVLRGPANRGNARATFVSQSRISQSVTDDTEVGP
jgi:hypothetical protein